MGDQSVDQLLGEIDELLSSQDSNTLLKNQHISNTQPLECSNPPRTNCVDPEYVSNNLSPPDRNDEWESSLNCSDFLSPAPVANPLKSIHNKTPANRAAAAHRNLAMPSPFSPMPHYQSMPLERLKSCLRMYGLRDSMSRKRILEVLERIYDETHQYETDSEHEGIISTSPKSAPATQNYDLIKEATYKGFTTNKHKVSRALHTPQCAKNCPTSSSDEAELVEGAESVEGVELLDEAELAVVDELSDESSDTPKSQSDPEKSLLSLFRQNESLRIRMLIYKPIPHKELLATVKELGVKIKPELIYDWCFEKGIILSFEENNKKRNIAQKSGPKQRKISKKTPQAPAEPSTMT